MAYVRNPGDELKKPAHIIALSALIFFLQPVSGWSSDRSLTTADAAIDLPIPDSAAFTALGFGPSLVENPSSPRALAGSLLQGFDAKGNSRTGISIEGAPFLLYHDRRKDLRGYQNEDASKVLDRTMLSLAAVKGGSEVEASTRLALGIRVTIWDAGEPRMDKDLADCLRNALIDVDVRRKRELDELTDEIDRLQIQREHVEDQIDSASRVASKKRTIKSLEDTVRALIRKTIRLNRQREALLATGAGELNNRESPRYNPAEATSVSGRPSGTGPAGPSVLLPHTPARRIRGTTIIPPARQSGPRLLSPSRTAAS